MEEKNPAIFSLRKAIQDYLKNSFDSLVVGIRSLNKEVSALNDRFNKTSDENKLIISSIIKSGEEEKKERLKDKRETISKLESIHCENRKLLSKLINVVKNDSFEKRSTDLKTKKVKIENIDEIIIPEFPKKIKIEHDDYVQKVKLVDEIKPPIINITEKNVSFPDVQDVRLVDKIQPPVINITEKNINFPEIQKVELVDKIDPPTINITEKVIKFPEIQKVELVDKINFDFPPSFLINNLPVAKGKKPSVKEANPEVYIPVRITNGDMFVDNFGGGNNIVSHGGSGSSLPSQWITSSGIVDSSSTLILETNQMRKFANITNDSNSIIYLSFGEEAKVNNGIRLNPNGGSYEIGSSNYFNGNVFAISQDSGSNVCILEVSLKVGD